MQCCGVTDVTDAKSTLSLQINYLSDKCQYVEYNGHGSNNLPIFTDVPKRLCFRAITLYII